MRASHQLTSDGLFQFFRLTDRNTASGDVPWKTDLGLGTGSTLSRVNPVSGKTHCQTSQDLTAAVDDMFKSPGCSNLWGHSEETLHANMLLHRKPEIDVARAA